MNIDWFIVAAQIVNFLVLVWLLQRLLYRPIVRAMRAREQEIADRMHAAEQKQAEADAAAETYRRRLSELDTQRAEQLAAIANEAEERRSELLQQARMIADERQAQWETALHRGQDEFLHHLRTQIGSRVYAIARRALTEIADTDLEEQAVRVFLRRFRNGDPAEWRMFVESAREARRPIVVRSAFKLPTALQAEIEDALVEMAGKPVDVRFDIQPHLIAGVELQAQSCIAAWQLGAYLDMLEESTLALMESELSHEELHRLAESAP